MATFGKKRFFRQDIDIRRLSGTVCTVVFVFLIFLWEPLGGTLGSVLWTVLMIIDLLALSGISCALDISEQMRSGPAVFPVSYRTIVKMVVTVLLVILLILMGSHAAKERRLARLAEEYGFTDTPAVTESDAPYIDPEEIIQG